MKTGKIAMMVAVFIIATFSYAGIDPGNQLTVKIPLKKALQNRSLVRVMYEQLDMSFLQNDQIDLYVGKVKFRGATYLIYGTYEEWINFFTMDPDDGGNIGNTVYQDFNVKPHR